MRRTFAHHIASDRSLARALFFAGLLSTLVVGSAPARQNFSPAADPKPASRIDLSALDYHPPWRSDRLTEDESSVSLNFVDATHVLLTFNRKGLLKRLPSCPPDHQDRLMHEALRVRVPHFSRALCARSEDFRQKEVRKDDPDPASANLRFSAISAAFLCDLND